MFYFKRKVQVLTFGNDNLKKSVGIDIPAYSKWKFVYFS